MDPSVNNPRLTLRFPIVQDLIYLCMPCPDLFVWIRAVLRFACERLGDCFPDRLTTSLTVLEIVYYIVAIVLFTTQLVLLCLGRDLPV